jgi:hypothetical protein
VAGIQEQQEVGFAELDWVSLTDRRQRRQEHGIYLCSLSCADCLECSRRWIWRSCCRKLSLDGCSNLFTVARLAMSAAENLRGAAKLQPFLIEGWRAAGLVGMYLLEWIASVGSFVLCPHRVGQVVHYCLILVSTTRARKLPRAPTKCHSL